MLKIRRNRPLLRTALLISAAAMLTCSYATADATDGPYPGLPRYTQQGGWAGATQSGVTEAAKARQWMRVPIQVVAAFTFTKHLPPAPSDPLENAEERGNYIFLVSPSGSAHNYGISPEFTARTVAFGSIPVEATVQLLQRRENGYPIPIVAKNRRQIWKTIPPGRASRYQETDTHVADSLVVRIARLVVDGVTLDLGKECQTVEPAALTLLGRGMFDDELANGQADGLRPWNTNHYVPGKGGRLSGTVDVPSFTGCVTTSGEDVSRLLTATVSGPDNEVVIHASAPVCSRPIPPATIGNGPPPPGSATAEEAGCHPDRIPPDVPLP